METNAQIVSLSLPFAAGVAVAALWGRPMEGAFAGSAAAGVLLAIAASGRGREKLLPAILFAAGMLCWCSEALLPP